MQLLENKQAGQWCAYSTEASWRFRVDALQAGTVASATYAGRSITQITVTVEDEAGDWMVYDDYSLDRKGQLQKLVRVSNILPGNRSEEQLFQMLNGRAVQQSRITRDLDSKKELPPSRTREKWLPQVPVVTRVQAFPFAALIGINSADVWSKGSVCVATPQAKL